MKWRWCLGLLGNGLDQSEAPDEVAVRGGEVEGRCSQQAAWSPPGHTHKQPGRHQVTLTSSSQVVTRLTASISSGESPQSRKRSSRSISSTRSACILTSCVISGSSDGSSGPREASAARRKSSSVVLHSKALPAGSHLSGHAWN